jgi:hypothetical protein
MADDQTVINLAEKQGYKDLTVAQLMEQLAGLPPMMLVFVQDHKINDSGEPWVLNKYFTGISILEDKVRGIPVLLLHASTYPESIPTFNDMSQEEQEAFKREQARRIAYYMKKGSEPSEFDK